MKATRILALLVVAVAANALDNPLSDIFPGSASGSNSASASTTPSSSAPAPSSASDSAPPSSSSPSPTSSDPPSSSTPTPPSTTLPSTTPSDTVSNIVSTNSAGHVVTVETTITNTPSVSASDTSPSASNTATSPSNSGLSTGGIIGLAVAGGVALICLAAFLIWKFTRKRMNGFDDNENIKWPELNDHSSAGNASMAPLPVTNTGRSGFGFDGGDDSRAPSRANTYDASTVDLHHEDTYAVPPLPHLNPNQPYRDDPNAGAGYYDPYHGPVPQTFNDAPQQEWGHEAIPMTQMAVGGRASPAPGLQGRMSPGPQAAYAAGRASPGPQAAYGRASPGPQAAYGASGRMSPGPQAAYGR